MILSMLQFDLRANITRVKNDIFGGNSKRNAGMCTRVRYGLAESARVLRKISVILRIFLLCWGIRGYFSLLNYG